MLVLSRKLGERIWIGDNICISVVDIQFNKIRLGIECPKDIPIYRQELLDAKTAREKAQAKQVDQAKQEPPQAS